MKAATILLAVLVAVSTLMVGHAHADGLLFSNDQAFKGLIESATYYEKKNLTGEAAHYYRLAVNKAQNDAERAQAHLGVGKNTPIRYGRPDPKSDGVTKLAAYQAVLDLAAAPATAKVDAHFGKAETYVALAKYDEALASLKALAAIPEATDAQERKATLWSGQILLEAKRYEEARVQLTEITKAADVSLGDKHTAHETIARSYLRQANLTDGLAEIARINALPGLTDAQRAGLHIENGALLAQEGQHKAARDEYAKVAILADATAEHNFISRYRIGESHFNEKNYAAARETWTQATEMRGSEKYAADLWKSIGIAYALEKNFDKAREAYQKWLAVPTLDYAGKVLAWQHVADAYVQEKKYAEAREALGNLSKLPPANATQWDKLQFKVRQQLDIADVYRTEGDFAKAGETYAAVLTDVPVGGAVEPPFFYDTRDLVQTAANAMAKDKASMTAAYTVYEALEKVYPYAKQDAEAFIGMGDILLAQGKPAEAKAKYQKALELRKTYDEGKTAQAKIRAIEAQGKPAT